MEVEQYKETTRTKLEGLEPHVLKTRLEAVDSDIKNLEDELFQREELLKFIDDLIAKKKKKRT